MGEADQLRLDFEHRPALGGDDFLVAPPNAEAVRWLDAWPDWPGPALVIYGAAGSGKSHLAQVFRAMSGAKVVRASDLRDSQPPLYLGDAPAAVLEDADVFCGVSAEGVRGVSAEGVRGVSTDGVRGVSADATGSLEEAVLHLYNHLGETGRHLMMTAKQAPARWGIGLEDLASRLNAASQAGIGPPDDGLIAAVLVKQFADRQLRIDGDVISFMLARMERSFEAARRMVAAIDDLALKQRRNITVALVRQVLQSEIKSEDE